MTAMADSSLDLLKRPGAGGPPSTAPQPPFDTLRDYVAALEAHGLLLRIPEVDQDAFQATGLVYRANDLYSFFGVPALYFERVKIGGKWVQGPLLGLLQANLHCDAIVFGQPVVPGDGKASYRNAKAYSRGHAAEEQRQLPADRRRSPSPARRRCARKWCCAATRST